MDEGTKTKRPRNPREHANPISAATFSYTFPIFMKGFKRDIEISDLPEVLSEHKSKLLTDKVETAWKEEEDRALKKKRDPSLRRVLIKCFGLEFLIYGFVLVLSESARLLLWLSILNWCLCVINTWFQLDVSALKSDLWMPSSEASVLGIGQALVLGLLVAYFTPNQTEITKTEAYFYAAAVALCSLANVLLVNPLLMGINHMAMKIKIACCSLIYRKTLKLSNTALKDTTVGQVINLLSNDVNRFDVALWFFHFLWLGPLETVVVAYLSYQDFGVSALIGIACLLVFIPLQMWMGRVTSVLRLKTALRTDERVRLMHEIISGIQVIKMYAWEKPFAGLVELTRKYEIKWIRNTSYVRGILLSSIMITTRISIYACLVAYILLGYDVNARQVFVLTTFYNVLRHTMTAILPQGIAQVSELNVSVKRLNKFLLYEETIVANKNRYLERNFQNKYKLKESTLKPVQEKGVFVRNVTTKWSDNSAENTHTNVSLTAKPAQLLAIIGPVGSGKSSLFHAILQELPVKEGSIKVRGEISYASQEPWLFAGSVRQNILFGLPMNETRYRKVIKVCSLERDFDLLPYGDKTLIGDRGVSLSGGQRARVNLARAVYKEADVYLLDDPLSAVDTHVGKELFVNCISGFLKDKICILVTHQLQYLKDVDHIIILEDGLVKAEGTYRELQNSSLDFAKLLEKHTDDEKQQEEANTSTAVVSRQNSVQSEQPEKAPVAVQEQRSKGSVGAYVYRAYFKAGGNFCVFITMTALFLLTQVAASVTDYFTTFWTNLEQQRTECNANDTERIDFFTKTLRAVAEYSTLNLSSETCVYIYTGIIVSLLCVTVTRSWLFFNVCMRASTNLHNRMFVSITRASMRFFNTNTSGRILNRFSKDVGAVDELLPAAMIDTFQIGLMVAGIVVIVAVINPWLLIPTALVGLAFALLRNFYLATSRSVKRLEGVTKSPVFAHINASLQGLTTIRAFKAESILQDEFDSHQDLHSSAFFNFLAISRAFGLWLDLVCVIYVTIVTFSFLTIGEERYGGDVGLAITQAIGLTGMFQWGMRQSTEVENQMTSVERILEYVNVESERSLESSEDKKPPSSWPEKGKVLFKNLFLRYDPAEPSVLKNLYLTVNPKEKIGIVGRTGAGKSSLIAAIFQLAYTEGSILIDDVDITELGLHDLRTKISIIPQEPFLFSGTLRGNLDPFDEFSNSALWKALEDVELKEAVEDLKDGLESKVSEGGTNFSVGQRQLICLARAILRNNKILVLDEATANVDPQTDALIQDTIRNKFADCTVLTIAHRLHTVMDSDKVLVMDAGRMVEFDHPFNLLQNKQGVFYGMVQQTGKAMADVLYRIAEQSAKKQQQLQS